MEQSFLRLTEIELKPEECARLARLFEKEHKFLPEVSGQIRVLHGTEKLSRPAMGEQLLKYVYRGSVGTIHEVLETIEGHTAYVDVKLFLPDKVIERRFGRDQHIYPYYDAEKYLADTLGGLPTLRP